jgi:hypothetical protein
MSTKLTNEIITAAIECFEAQKARIDGQISGLRDLLNGNPAETAATPGVPAPKRKRFSVAARRRMKEAQQRRWAKVRGESQRPLPAELESPKPKRKLSEAGRKAIIAATKRRWALKRAKAATTRPAAAKKASPAWKKAAAKKAAVKTA